MSKADSEGVLETKPGLSESETSLKVTVTTRRLSYSHEAVHLAADLESLDSQHDKLSTPKQEMTELPTSPDSLGTISQRAREQLNEGGVDNLGNPDDDDDDDDDDDGSLDDETEENIQQIELVFSETLGFCSSPSVSTHDVRLHSAASPIIEQESNHTTIELTLSHPNAKQPENFKPRSPKTLPRRRKPMEEQTACEIHSQVPEQAIINDPPNESDKFQIRDQPVNVMQSAGSLSAKQSEERGEEISYAVPDSSQAPSQTLKNAVQETTITETVIETVSETETVTETVVHKPTLRAVKLDYISQIASVETVPEQPENIHQNQLMLAQDEDNNKQGNKPVSPSLRGRKQTPPTDFVMSAPKLFRFDSMLLDDPIETHNKPAVTECKKSAPLLRFDSMLLDDPMKLRKSTQELPVPAYDINSNISDGNNHLGMPYDNNSNSGSFESMYETAPSTPLSPLDDSVYLGPEVPLKVKLKSLSLAYERDDSRRAAQEATVSTESAHTEHVRTRYGFLLPSACGQARSQV